MDYDGERRADDTHRVGRMERYLEALAKALIQPNIRPRDLREPSQTFLDALHPPTETEPVEM